jgi:hypothetical protein
MAEKLLRDIKPVSPENLDDLMLIMAKNIEESLFKSGARPGLDYSILDLYKLAQPFALEVFKKNINTMSFKIQW